MRKSTAVVIGLTVLLIVAIAAVFRHPERGRNAPERSPNSASQPGTGPSDTRKDGIRPSLAKKSALSAPARQSDRLLEQIHALLALLRKGGGTESAGALRDLKDDLRRADPMESIDAIRRFLATGQDAATGRPFRIGEAGALDDAPTLRVLLLDQLGRIGRGEADSHAISQLNREILDTKTSADEWAVAMRNVAWMEPGAGSYLSAKLRDALGYAPWQQTPSTGFLEAFDVGVYTRDVGLIPAFTTFLEGEDPSLQRASAVALDRLASAAPNEVMNYFNSNPSLLADRPLIRADYFAKADLSDPAQRMAFETYLNRLDVSKEEKIKALEGLQEPGTFISDNLLTPPPDPASDEKRMAGIQRVIGEWSAAGRFPDLLPPLQPGAGHETQ